MKINQLTQTDPIELARAVLTADDVQDFPIIHHAAIELLDKLKQFEVEYSYFEYEDGSIGGMELDEPHEFQRHPRLVRDFVIGDRLEMADGRVGTLTHEAFCGDGVMKYVTTDDGIIISVSGNGARLHVSE